jgi:hypothetical protein
MICETCHGRGWVWGDSLPVIGVMPGDPARPPVELSLKVPCEDCGGNGHAHCCDGLIAQGERDAALHLHVGDRNLVLDAELWIDRYGRTDPNHRSPRDVALRGVQRARGLRLWAARQPGASGRRLVLRGASGGGRAALGGAISRQLARPGRAALIVLCRGQVEILSPRG